MCNCSARPFDRPAPRSTDSHSQPKQNTASQIHIVRPVSASSPSGEGVATRFPDMVPKPKNACPANAWLSEDVWCGIASYLADDRASLKAIRRLCWNAFLAVQRFSRIAWTIRSHLTAPARPLNTDAYMHTRPVPLDRVRRLSLTWFIGSMGDFGAIETLCTLCTNARDIRVHLDWSDGMDQPRGSIARLRRILGDLPSIQSLSVIRQGNLALMPFMRALQGLLDDGNGQEIQWQGGQSAEKGSTSTQTRNTVLAEVALGALSMARDLYPLVCELRPRRQRWKVQKLSLSLPRTPVVAPLQGLSNLFEIAHLDVQMRTIPEHVNHIFSCLAPDLTSLRLSLPQILVGPPTSMNTSSGACAGETLDAARLFKLETLDLAPIGECAVLSQLVRHLPASIRRIALPGFCPDILEALRSYQDDHTSGSSSALPSKPPSIVIISLPAPPSIGKLSCSGFATTSGGSNGSGGHDAPFWRIPVDQEEQEERVGAEQAQSLPAGFGLYWRMLL